MSDIERAVDSVAASLSEVADLAADPVFLGGATIGLYLDAFGRSHLRPTLDVDCIVPGVRWYPEAVATAESWSLVTGRKVLAPTPAVLLACKLEAWSDRGRSDPYGSKDIEDIAALLDGCRALEQSIQSSSVGVRDAIAAGLDEIASDRTLRSVLLGNLPSAGESGSQRVTALVMRLTRRDA